jgi:hypothetical protein
MSKKRTPVKPQNPPKVTVNAAEAWPKIYEDVDHWWALEAIQRGNGAILTRYLREAKEIDPRVRRELAELLNPNSNHTWRLEACYRFRGKPSKQAQRLKSTFNDVIVNLANLLSGTDPLDPRCPQALADMLNPVPRHELRLDLKQRKSGKNSSNVAEYLAVC